MAALFRFGPDKWRSKQFSETFSLPPTNHFALGAFQSKTFFQRLDQTSWSASRPQNLSGRLIDCRYIRRYCARLLIRACWANFFGGLKTRFSTRCDSMFCAISVRGYRPPRSAQWKVGEPNASDL